MLIKNEILDLVVSAKQVMRAIVDYAQTNHFDLIIVGTRGSHKIRRLLIGSVASGVVTNSHCPVMVIK
jgi:nucleotide-binding universal stress UspA family protein